MDFRVYARRERRSMLNQGLGYGPIGYTIANYSTDAVIDKKVEIKPYEEEIINTINCIPDPLKKNLADSVLSSNKILDKPEKMPPDPSDFYYTDNIEPETHQNHSNIYSSLQGISSFFSNFFGAITSSVFMRRAKSPTQYFDCYDSSGLNTEMPPPTWQQSNMQDQNKTLAPDYKSNDNMNSYRSTVAQCEQKLTVVKGLLPGKHVVAPPKFRRKPRKVFVEPGSVQETAEDTFASDDYVSLPNGDYIEYVSVKNNHCNGLSEIDAAKMKIEASIEDNSIIKNLTDTKANGTVNTTEINVAKMEIEADVRGNSRIKDLRNTEAQKHRSKETQKYFDTEAQNTINTKQTLELKVQQNVMVKDLTASDIKTQFSEQSHVKSDLNQTTTILTNCDSTKVAESVTVAMQIPTNMATKSEDPNIAMEIKERSSLVTEKLEPSTVAREKLESSMTATEKFEIPISVTEIRPEILITDTEKLKNSVKIQETNSNTAILSNSELSTASCDNNVKSSESVLKLEETKVGITKEELISSVEDKMAKLKLLFQEKRKKTKSTPMDPVKDTTENTVSSIKDPVKVTKDDCHDKKFKNPHRLTEKRTKSKLRKNIQEDMRFANEIDSSDISSVENSPKHQKHLKIPAQNHRHISNDTLSDSSKSPNDQDYFDELKGRFHTSSTTESEDSFQIVFTDSPKRCRKPSDCESEDSFIMFEDTPDSCYSSHDVFGNHETTDTESDSESDISDSGCIPKLKLSQNLSRTVSDLTDNSLYEDRNADEIDCAVRTFEEIPSKDLTEKINSDSHKLLSQVLSEPNLQTIPKSDIISQKSDIISEKSDKISEKSDIASVITDGTLAETDITSENCLEVTLEDQDSESVIDSVKRGLLMDEERKRLRKSQPKKSVSFSTAPPKVHVMRVWAFAARQARAGHWERHAVDRERFKRRIADIDMAVSWVLKPQHRRRIMFQRFMPWWNHLKRLEIAEKKRLKEEEEQRKKEEEERRVKEEEERRVREEEEEEERRVKEEEERLREEKERLAREEEQRRREIDEKELNGVVENKNGVQEETKNAANGKHKYNSKYSKPMSAYLKQKKKIVVKTQKQNVESVKNDTIPQSTTNANLQKPVINIDDIVVGKRNQNIVRIPDEGYSKKIVNGAK